MNPLANSRSCPTSPCSWPRAVGSVLDTCDAINELDEDAAADSFCLKLDETQKLSVKKAAAAGATKSISPDPIGAAKAVSPVSWTRPVTHDQRDRAKDRDRDREAERELEKEKLKAAGVKGHRRRSPTLPCRPFVVGNSRNKRSSPSASPNPRRPMLRVMGSGSSVSSSSSSNTTSPPGSNDVSKGSSPTRSASPRTSPPPSPSSVLPSEVGEVAPGTRTGLRISTNSRSRSPMAARVGTGQGGRSAAATSAGMRPRKLSTHQVLVGVSDIISKILLPLW